MINPLHDRILIKPNNPETTTRSGIIIPDIAQDKPQIGTVIKVGPGKDGYPLEVREHDTVIFQKGAGISISLQGENYLVLKEEEIIGIMN